MGTSSDAYKLNHECAILSLVSSNSISYWKEFNVSNTYTI